MSVCLLPEFRDKHRIRDKSMTLKAPRESLQLQKFAKHCGVCDCVPICPPPEPVMSHRALCFKTGDRET